jgi:hypothetical protein
MRAKWYRNPPEKDQDKPQGEGEIIHFGLLERSGEGIAVIVDDEGNIVEKPFSLVRIVTLKPELAQTAIAGGASATPKEYQLGTAKVTVPPKVKASTTKSPQSKQK